MVVPALERQADHRDSAYSRVSLPNPRYLSRVQSPWQIRRWKYYFTPITLCDPSVDSYFSCLSQNQRLGSNLPLSLSPRRDSFTVMGVYMRSLWHKGWPSFHRPKAKRPYSFFFLPKVKQFFSRQPWQELRLFCASSWWQDRSSLMFQVGFRGGKGRRSSHFSMC